MSWVTSSKKILFSSLLLALGGCGKDPTAPVLIEDFSTTTYLDSTTSTGLWNSYQKRLQAPLAPTGNAAWKLDFGAGSDGAVSSSQGYTFDTSRTYEFSSLQITGGTITVTGNQPLIIRSQGIVTISPTLNISGSAASGATGGSAVAAPASGGAGGTATGDGAGGITSAGAADTNGGGGSGSGAVGSGSNAADIPGTTDFDTTGFISGTGGGGGGAWNAVAGGGGGGAGGRIRIVALGPINVGLINSSGGAGADGGGTNPNCSGAGSGGGGGAIWLQTAATITTSSTPLVAAGAGVTVHSCASTPDSSDGWAGAMRGDTATGGNPGWGAGQKAVQTITGTWVVDSKAYNLGTLNAEFYEAPQITSDAGGGSVAITYSGSQDGTTWGSYVSDITTLSNLNFKYIKFRATLTFGAGTTPSVSRIAIPYREKGFDNVDLKLSAGCGSMIKNLQGPRRTSPWELLLGGLYCGLWILAAKLACATFRRRLI